MNDNSLKYDLIMLEKFASFLDNINLWQFADKVDDLIKDAERKKKKRKKVVNRINNFLTTLSPADYTPEMAESAVSSIGESMLDDGRFGLNDPNTPYKAAMQSIEEVLNADN